MSLSCITLIYTTKPLVARARFAMRAPACVERISVKEAGLKCKEPRRLARSWSASHVGASGDLTRMALRITVVFVRYRALRASLHDEGCDDTCSVGTSILKNQRNAKRDVISIKASFPEGWREPLDCRSLERDYSAESGTRRRHSGGRRQGPRRLALLQ